MILPIVYKENNLFLWKKNSNNIKNNEEKCDFNSIFELNGTLISLNVYGNVIKINESYFEIEKIKYCCCQRLELTSKIIKKIHKINSPTLPSNFAFIIFTEKGEIFFLTKMSSNNTYEFSRTSMLKYVSKFQVSFGEIIIPRENNVDCVIGTSEGEIFILELKYNYNNNSSKRIWVENYFRIENVWLPKSYNILNFFYSYKSQKSEIVLINYIGNWLIFIVYRNMKIVIYNYKERTILFEKKICPFIDEYILDYPSFIFKNNSCNNLSEFLQLKKKIFDFYIGVNTNKRYFLYYFSCIMNIIINENKFSSLSDEKIFLEYFKYYFDVSKDIDVLIKKIF